MIRATLLALASISLLSCVQYEQGTVLMPDGSGRLSMTVRVSRRLMEGFGGAGQSPADDMSDPDKLDEKIEGISAWTRPVPVESPDWIGVTMTGYFDDIRKVRMFEDDKGERKLQMSFGYDRKGPGGVLTVRNAMTDKLNEMTPPEEEGDEEARKMARGMMAMMTEMMKGLKFSFSVSVPGAVTEAPAWPQREGRTVSLVFDDQMLFDAVMKKEGAKEKLDALSGDHSITWASTDVSEADQKAFAKELAEAKAAWGPIREELAKKAAERRSKEEAERNVAPPAMTEESEDEEKEEPRRKVRPVRDHADRPLIAIVDFSDPSGEEDGRAGTAASETLVSALMASNQVRIIDPAKVREAIGELKLAKSGVVDPAAAMTVGKVLGCRYVVYGAVMSVGFSEERASGRRVCEVSVRVRMIEAETGEVIAAVKHDGRGARELEAGMSAEDRKTFDAGTLDKALKQAVDRALENLLDAIE